MLARVSQFSFFPALQVKLDIYDILTYKYILNGSINGHL